MSSQILSQSCCTTPAAMCFWAAIFLVIYGTGLAVASVWPALSQYHDTLILGALAAACFINFARNRTLHCALTGPLFVAAAVVMALGESGLWPVPTSAVWGVVLLGVGLAFLVEWRSVAANTER
jgi:hypothetical protein